MRKLHYSLWRGTCVPLKDIGISLLSRSLFMGLLFLLSSVAMAQTVHTNYNNTVSSFQNQNVQLNGKGLLTITGNSGAVNGSTINLTSSDAWVYFPNVRPSEVVNNVLDNIRINGATATHGSNCRVSIYVEGAMIIPHSSTFTALTVYADNNLNGSSTGLNINRHYKDGELGSLNNNIQSFRLKKGYMATFASNADGTGTSRVYIASEGDIVVSSMPSGLSNTVSMVTVRPWIWTAKKSWRGGAGGSSGADRFGATSRYDYNNSGAPSLDNEYIPMRHNPNWNAYSNFYSKYDCTHALHFNEPDNSVDDGYATVATALSQWPSMLESGLRVGSPACTDGGLSWLYGFMDQADNLGYRVDFVAWHWYRAFQSAEQLYNALEAVHQATGRPIWITEFNNGCNWTYEDWVPSTADNGTKIQSWIDMLENAPFVERYVVWDGCNETLRMTNSSNGDLYPAGVAYRDKTSTMAYTNDYYTNDMGSADVAGTVQIKNRGTGMILDSWDGTDPGNSAIRQQSGSSTHDNSKWELVPVNSSYGSIYYYIKNVGTGMVIDGWGRTSDGSDVTVQASTTTHVNAQWRLEAIKGNYYRIKNRGTGMYLDGAGSTSVGANAKQYANTRHVNAQWELISATATGGGSSLAGTYQIQNRGTSMFIDGAGGTSNGSAAKQWANTTSANARWTLVVDGSNYKIQNVGTGLVLDGYGRTANGDAVAQYASSTTHPNAKWEFLPVTGSDGITYHYIQNVGTGLKMDGFGRTANGDEVAQYSNTTTSVNAQWRLLPISASRLADEESISDAVSPELKLYPNPVGSSFSIAGVEDLAGVQIFSVSGENMEGHFAVKVNNIDVSTLAPGIYILRLETPDHSEITRRFVKVD